MEEEIQHTNTQRIMLKLRERNIDIITVSLSGNIFTPCTKNTEVDHNISVQTMKIFGHVEEIHNTLRA